MKSDEPLRELSLAAGKTRNLTAKAAKNAKKENGPENAISDHSLGDLGGLGG
jgi:hypothetical protein